MSEHDLTSYGRDAETPTLRGIFREHLQNLRAASNPPAGWKLYVRAAGSTLLSLVMIGLAGLTIVGRYYWEHRREIVAYFREQLPGVPRPETHLWEIRIGPGDSIIGVEEQDGDWQVVLPEYCVVTGEKTNAPWMTEIRYAEDVSRPILCVVASVPIGIILSLICGTILMWPLSLLAGAVCGYFLRRTRRVQVRYKRSPSAPANRNLPLVRVHNHELILLVGASIVRQRFLHPESDLSVPQTAAAGSVPTSLKLVDEVEGDTSIRHYDGTPMHPSGSATTSPPPEKEDSADVPQAATSSTATSATSRALAPADNDPFAELYREDPLPEPERSEPSLLPMQPEPRREPVRAADGDVETIPLRMIDLPVSHAAVSTECPSCGRDLGRETSCRYCGWPDRQTPVAGPGKKSSSPLQWYQLCLTPFQLHALVPPAFSLTLWTLVYWCFGGALAVFLFRYSPWGAAILAGLTLLVTIELMANRWIEAAAEAAERPIRTGLSLLPGVTAILPPLLIAYAPLIAVASLPAWKSVPPPEIAAIDSPQTALEASVDFVRALPAPLFAGLLAAACWRIVYFPMGMSAAALARIANPLTVFRWIGRCFAPDGVISLLLTGPLTLLTLILLAAGAFGVAASMGEIRSLLADPWRELWPALQSPRLLGAVAVLAVAVLVGQYAHLAESKLAGQSVRRHRKQLTT